MKPWRGDDSEAVVADSWAVSVAGELERSRRIAWIVAAAASAIALLLALALVLLLPLKTSVPYTLMVDRQTGHVEALEPLEEAMVAPETALTRSQLAQYVVARESFERASLQRDYRKAMLFSAGPERRRYAASLSAGNPAAPFAQVPAGGRIETEIKSISPLAQNQALVRFATSARDAAGRILAVQHYASVVDYLYSRAEMSADDRLLNPLGFQVTRYRRDPETMPELATDITANAAPATAPLSDPAA